MKRILIFVALATLAACSNGFKAEYQQLMQQHEQKKARLLELQSEQDIRMQSYQQMRLEFEERIGGGMDSTVASILEFHNGLILNHEALRAEHPNIIAIHEGLLARHSIKDYPQDSILADYQVILGDYERIEHEYEGIRADMNQMLDEQDGMLKKYWGD
jgi:hypothetical protein